MNHWIIEMARFSFTSHKYYGKKTYKNILSTATNRAENFLTENWSLRQGEEEVNKRIKQKIIIFDLNDKPSSGAIFKLLFVTNFQFYLLFLLAPEEDLSFKPKYWASFFKDIFFVSFFCFLIYPLVVRISLRLKNFLHGLSLWTCWYFIFS